MHWPLNLDSDQTHDSKLTLGGNCESWFVIFNLKEILFLFFQDAKSGIHQDILQEKIIVNEDNVSR